MYIDITKSILVEKIRHEMKVGIRITAGDQVETLIPTDQKKSELITALAKGIGFGHHVSLPGSKAFEEWLRSTTKQHPNDSLDIEPLLGLDMFCQEDHFDGGLTLFLCDCEPAMQLPACVEADPFHLRKNQPPSSPSPESRQRKHTRAHLRGKKK
jgi:hypothetical protein